MNSSLNKELRLLSLPCKSPLSLIFDRVRQIYTSMPHTEECCCISIYQLILLKMIGILSPSYLTSYAPACKYLLSYYHCIFHVFHPPFLSLCLRTFQKAIAAQSLQYLLWHLVAPWYYFKQFSFILFAKSRGNFTMISACL